MTATVWLERHGHRADFGGRTHERHEYDSPLSDLGRQQAAETGRRLRGEGIRHVIASPFRRTVETAHAIATELDAPVLIEPGAGEWYNAAWFAYKPPLDAPASLTHEFPRVDPAYQPLIHPAFPETEPQALAREAATIRALIDRFGSDFLVVGHGHSVMGMTLALAGGERLLCGVCALVKLVRNTQGWRCDLPGDTRHLTSGEQDRSRWI